MSAIPDFRRVEESRSRVVEVMRQVGLGDAPQEWPTPTPIVGDLPPAPEFNGEVLLPEPLRGFVLDTADRMVVSPDFVAAPLLVAMGSVVGAKCGLKPKRRDDWVVVPNLWGGVVGDPSSKKTPSASAVMRFIDGLEAKAARDGELVLAAYEAELKAFEAHQAAIKAAMTAAAKGKGKNMGQAVKDLAALRPPEKPSVRRFRTNDSSVAMLGELLKDNPHGLLVFRDELIGLLSSWDRQGCEGDRAFYLEAWNGSGGFNVDRIQRGSIRIENLCLSVFGGIQPDLLERYLGGIAHSLDNDGRVQRFQVLVYPDLVGWEWRDRHPARGVRESMRDVFDHLAVFDPIEAGAAAADSFIKLPHFHFDDAAQEIFIEWTTELHRVRIAQESNGLMAQHLAKFEKLFASLALIFHLQQVRPGPVSADSAARAAAWCQHLEAHARRVYGLLEVGAVKAANTLGRKLAEGKLGEGFTPRDVARKGWGGLATTAAAEQALALLEDHGWVASTDVQHPLGGPLTRRFHINPKLGAQP